MKKIIFVIVLFAFQFADAEEKAPLCSSLTDQFCQELWSPKNNGNLAGKNFAFYFGDSEKSDGYLREVLYMQNFLDHEKDYPEEFQKDHPELFENLRKILSQETHGPIWYATFSSLMNQIPDLIWATSRRTLVQKYPKYNEIKWSDISQAGKTVYQQSYYDLIDKILDAQFANHPNWIRIQKIFSEVKSDLIELIDSKFPLNTRAYAKSKIIAVQLSLPYASRKAIVADFNCSTFGTAAFYLPDINKFTMCAGRINAIQDDAATYLTIAHEMGHAIDPRQLAMDDFKFKEIIQPIVKMCKAPNPIMGCVEWENYKKSFAKNIDYTMGISPYDKLTSCLRSREGLGKFNKKDIQSFAKKCTRKFLDEYATDNSFTTLAQTTVEKNGKRKVNEYYLRPDLLRIHDNRDIAHEGTCSLSVIPELFTQIYSCEQKNKSENRSIAFENTLATLQSFLESLGERWLWSCGRECYELETENMSVDSTERFSDWVGYKLFAKRLAREKTLEDKRNFVAHADAILCREPGPWNDAPDLTRIEKFYSFEPHPDDRVRRLAIFQPEIVDILKCVPSEEITNGYQSCDF